MWMWMRWNNDERKSRSDWKLEAHVCAPAVGTGQETVRGTCWAPTERPLGERWAWGRGLAAPWVLGNLLGAHMKVSLNPTSDHSQKFTQRGSETTIKAKPQHVYRGSCVALSLGASR